MSDSDGLVPITISQGMVGRTLLTTRNTASSMKSASKAPTQVLRAGNGAKCPCCDQPVDVPTVAMIVDEWGLSPLQARILEAVWKGKGHPVSTEAIFASMYRDDADGGPTEGEMYLSFKVALHYLRVLLVGSGVGIKTVGYRRGYKLVITERTRTEGPEQCRRSWNLRGGNSRKEARPTAAVHDLFEKNGR